MLPPYTGISVRWCYLTLAAHPITQTCWISLWLVGKRGRRYFHCFSRFSGDYSQYLKHCLPQKKHEDSETSWGTTLSKKNSTSLKGWLGSQASKPAELSSSQEQGLMFTHSHSALVVTATHPSTVPSSSLLFSVMILRFLVTWMACCILFLFLPIAPSYVCNNTSPACVELSNLHSPKIHLNRKFHKGPPMPRTEVTSLSSKSNESIQTLALVLYLLKKKKKTFKTKLWFLRPALIRNRENNFSWQTVKAQEGTTDPWIGRKGAEKP